jgi:hypothetical protein
MATRAGFVLLRNVRSATLCFGGSMCVQREAKRRDAVGRESRSRRVKTFEYIVSRCRLVPSLPDAGICFVVS